MEKKPANIFLHAPNVHVGGGLVLLQDVLKIPDSKIVWAQLDARASKSFSTALCKEKRFVSPSFLSRLKAEWTLRRVVPENDILLCFHGIPPLFPICGRVVVFVQNRLLFESSSLSNYPLLTRLRLFAERLWVRAFWRNCDLYMVQTRSMATAVRKCLGRTVEVSVRAFMPSVDCAVPERLSAPKDGTNFVYIASGEAHKNHANLLKAWRLLADAELKPSLTLTVDPKQYPTVSYEITRYAREFALNIVNLGTMEKEDISALYLSSTALIFPSLTESLGLPLIEASRLGLPIIASELDYVRDVVRPAETFDPGSPISIARSVRRFLDHEEPVAKIYSAADFLTAILS